tara:strand:+ start:17336 stop:19279 length:1944 start_codon:yes stop_codon:yes gene_type:complete
MIIRLVRPFAALAMAAFAIPSALAQDAPPLEAYGDLPGVEDMAISHSGEYFAFFATVAGTPQVVIFDKDQNVMRQIALGELKFRSFSFIGDEALLLWRSQTLSASVFFAAGQYELSQAVVVPVDSARAPTTVFGEEPSLMSSVFGDYGTRMVDGRWRGYFGAIEYARAGDYRTWVFDHGRPALYEYDFAKGNRTRAAPSPPEGYSRRWLVDGAGTVAVTFNLGEDGSFEFRNSVGQTIAEGFDAEGDVRLNGFGPQGDTLLYSLESEDDGEYQLLELPLAGGESRPFLPDVSIDRYYWNRDARRLIGYLADGELTMFDPAIQKRARAVLAAFPSGNPVLMDWTPQFTRVLVHTSGNEDSGTWYLVDLVQRRADAVGFDRPTIAPEQVGPISTVSYTAQDGLEMDAVVTLPPGREAKDLPVIVLPHGGPHAHDEEGFDWWAQAFASRGYAVIQPNFRGSTGHGQSFERAGYGEWGRKMQTDISDALAALAERGVVDPARACIVGASYGGYAALAGVTLQQGLYRCAVSVAGIGDIGLMYRTETRESAGNRLFKRSLREELGDSSEWDAISPRKFAAQADAPILLIHGLDDTIVDFEQSAKMADALKDEGKPYRLVELEGEDHWLSLAATRKQMLSETMAFVQEHNPAD